MRPVWGPVHVHSLKPTTAHLIVTLACCRVPTVAAPAPWQTCAPPSTTTAAAGATPSAASSTTPASMTSGPLGGWASTASQTTAHPPSAASARLASKRHPQAGVSRRVTSATAWVLRAAALHQLKEAEVSQQQGWCLVGSWVESGCNGALLPEKPGVLRSAPWSARVQYSG
jgi:hypothetical protein